MLFMKAVNVCSRLETLKITLKMLIFKVRETKTKEASVCFLASKAENLKIYQFNSI